jgi:hypothetical protein
MRTAIVNSALLGLYAFAFTGAAGLATQFRGKTIELTPGMSPIHLALNRGPSPSKIDPAMSPARGTLNSTSGDWLSPPENVEWGYIDDYGVSHGTIDLVWAFEGVPSFDGKNYNTLSQETLDLIALLAQVNADAGIQPPNDPAHGRRSGVATSHVEQVRSSLTKRATSYACNSNHGALHCHCEIARDILAANANAELDIDGNRRAGYVVGSCAIVANLSRPGWTKILAYQLIADAIPIIDNCWIGVNQCSDYRSGVSQASNNWPKTCVCNNNSQGSC